MGAKVQVDGKTVVHVTSDGHSSAFPDVCLTPPVPVPVPYTNTAETKDAAIKLAATVATDGQYPMLRGSCEKTSKGDEPGSDGGVISGVNKGKSYFTLYSQNTKFDGRNVVRLGDSKAQNHEGYVENCHSPAQEQPNFFALEAKEDAIDLGAEEAAFALQAEKGLLDGGIDDRGIPLLEAHVKQDVIHGRVHEEVPEVVLLIASSSSSSSSSKVKVPKGPCLEKVLSLTITVPGTKSVRTPATHKADTVLHKSGTSEDLAANPPTVLVRGCNQVTIEAITSPAGHPVKWQVKRHGAGGNPVLTPTLGGRSATLHTDKHGAFSIIATVCATKRVWNVVFVWVNVLPATSSILGRKTGFADSGSSVASTGFQSGTFVPTKFAWEGRVKVQLVGGPGKLGVDKVHLHVLQNGVLDDLRANYAPGETGTERPMGSLPILDSNDGTSSFVYFASCFKETPATGGMRTVWTGDSPAGGFPNAQTNTLTRIRSISGHNGFRTSIVGVSADAPGSYVAAGDTRWTADFSGNVTFPPPPAPPVAHYTRTTANVTHDLRYAVVSPATGGQDCFDAGLEVFPPRFNGGTLTNWVP